MIRVYFLMVLSLKMFAADVLQDNSCITPNQEEGTCLTLTKCPLLQSAFEILSLDQAVQLLKDSQCSCDKGKLCCGSSIKKNYRQLVNCSPAPKGNITIARISDPTICGLDKYNTGRIQGGEVADFGEFPWLVAIESKSKFKKDNAGIRCGGSILTKRYIMTAAHCIAHQEFVATRVWLGVTNIGPEGNCYNITSQLICINSSVKKMKIEKMFPHPGYEHIEKRNDIGLVRVENSIEYTDYIRPICLPSPDSAVPRVGISMTVAGWGATEQKGIGSKIKLKINLPVQNNSMCNTFLPKKITALQLCVGGEKGKDSCEGDSGGPLMKGLRNSNEDTQFYQEGIVSYGRGCGREGRPAVYTRVAPYVKWISATIDNERFNLENGDPCSTPNGSVGKCIPLTSCEKIFKTVSTKNKDGYSFAKQSKCGYDHETLVCCESPASMSLANFDSKALPDKTICGEVKDTPRIYGGTQADLGQFPWMVAIEYTTNRGSKNAGIRCAGTVINKRYVLTTSTCLLDIEFEPSSVLVGDWNITSNPDCKQLVANIECADPVQKIPVQKAIPHLYYDSINKQNDIALILLENEIKYNDYVAPICLPSPNLPILKLGTSMTIAGWGETENHQNPDTLRYVEVPMVTNDKCNEILARAHLAISLQELCVGGEGGKDSCIGDAGGPLVTIQKDKASGKMHWYQYGLTSNGFGCGGEGRPSIYTRVTSYSSWIINIISED